MKDRWKLSERDLELAINQYKEEKIYPMTKPQLFWGGLYSLLSAADNYYNLLYVCDRLQREGFVTPEAILEEGEKDSPIIVVQNNIFEGATTMWSDTITGVARNRNRLTQILKKKRFANFAVNKVYGFSNWWIKNGDRLFYDITGDLASGGKREFEIRDGIHKETPGLGMKCASLFMRMCGYENVAPVDIWMLRFLVDAGHKRIPVHDFERTPGISKKDYLEFETWVSEIGRNETYLPEFWRKPGNFQLALWAKNSSMNPENLVDTRQMYLGI